jgi:hypothetical protein
MARSGVAHRGYSFLVHTYSLVPSNLIHRIMKLHMGLPTLPDSVTVNVSNITQHTRMIRMDYTLRLPGCKAIGREVITNDDRLRHFTNLIAYNGRVDYNPHGVAFKVVEMRGRVYLRAAIARESSHHYDLGNAILDLYRIIKAQAMIRARQLKAHLMQDEIDRLRIRPETVLGEHIRLSDYDMMMAEIEGDPFNG